MPNKNYQNFCPTLLDRNLAGCNFFLEFDTFFSIQFKNTYNFIFLGVKVPYESFFRKDFKIGLTFWHRYVVLKNIKLGRWDNLQKFWDDLNNLFEQRTKGQNNFGNNVFLTCSWRSIRSYSNSNLKKIIGMKKPAGKVRKKYD